jgi:hypothetical protein
MKNYSLKLEDDKFVDSNESLFKRTINKQYSNGSMCCNNAKKDKEQLNSNNSHIITGSWANEIHKENVEKLSKMKEDEIKQEKGHLEAVLDPRTIAFIKSMKNSKNKSKSKILEACKNKVIENNKMELDEQAPCSIPQEFENHKIDVEDKNVVKKSIKKDINQMSLETDTYFKSLEKELPEPVIDLVKTAEQEGWVHMDDLEPEKVKWMQDLPESQDNKLPQEPYNARFDFQGKKLYEIIHLFFIRDIADQVNIKIYNETFHFCSANLLCG